MEKKWLKSALFAGMTANAFKLGTVLTSGWFWVRFLGCTLLYRGQVIDKVDFENILDVAACNASELSPPDYTPHDNNLSYYYVVRRANSCGYEECTFQAAVKVVIDGQGELAVALPNNILDVKVRQLENRKVQFVWSYSPLDQQDEAASFSIYSDGGSGQIDYQNPLAQISYKGKKFYSWKSNSLDVGTHLFAIRPTGVNGGENTSLAQVRIQIADSPPQTADIVTTESI